MDRLPEALVSRFAVATRDVLWFKNKVLEFFERAGVPSPIMRDLRAEKDSPTIKLCHRLVDLLEQMGADGQKVLQTLFTQVSERADLSHLKPEKRATAREAQEALKAEIRAYADQKKFFQRQEREQQQEREARQQIRAIDHKKLESFRERFDRIFALSDEQKRGNEFEQLLNDIFDYYCPKNRGPFRREGEQVDGHFQFDGHHYFCEIRWRSEKANAADISVLRDRAAAGFGGDVRALFISFNGFTSECLAALSKRAASERVILMDGMDLRCVLNSDIAFDVLLDEKLAYAVREDRPFVSAREIIMNRLGIEA